MNARPLRFETDRVVAPVLSRHEQIVLQVVVRFPDRKAINERIEGERQMTQSQWAAARRSLINKRMLDRTGAITEAGRKAAGDILC